ncbi:MAG: hypothetical protein ACLTDV_14230 [Eubacterium sp.]
MEYGDLDMPLGSNVGAAAYENTCCIGQEHVRFPGGNLRCARGWLERVTIGTDRK